jgi:hypothetical protein
VGSDDGMETTLVVVVMEEAGDAEDMAMNLRLLVP